MSITFREATKIFTLTTDHTMYQMKITKLGHLMHLYYGQKTESDMDYLYPPQDCGFSPNPNELRHSRGGSLDLLPQEYSSSNVGDYRVCSLDLVTEKGVWGADLRYVSHEIHPGKYSVTGMPSAFDRGGEAETLIITLADKVTGIQVELRYGVFAERDILTRNVRLTNQGRSVLHLEKAASACLELPFGEWEMMHFHGRHTMERVPERQRLLTGTQSIASRRGSSSHQHNPFVILCESAATEEAGECYGLMLVYSGNHKEEIEVNQQGAVRVAMGISEEQFSWTLHPGDSFETPEVILGYSHQGLTGLSQRYHRFLRQNICRSKFANRRRPILINNWEATYFDFTEEKILQIARQAKELGVEMLVLDDGWFGHRDDDNSSLGDWYVNESKLPGGLGRLIQKVNEIGLKFGLWVEPEMVSEDSDLYRAHPDWALAVPGRAPAFARNQMMLDLSREDVVNWLYRILSDLLRNYPIEYIKWDMNRNLTDVYSRRLTPDRQGEVTHRYVLGLYDLLKRLTEEFPDVLFEGCSGGGGRFDAAMLAYSPQIWCSDDTDAIERLVIQNGTSFGYPVSFMGSHVSAVPNHQTGRLVSLGTRGVVAMAGTFGYELDLNLLSGEEKEEVRRQILRYQEYADLIREGDYYRLTDTDGDMVAWQLVSEDKTESLISLVMVHSRPGLETIHFRIRGLDPKQNYQVIRDERFGAIPGKEMTGLRISGAALMYGGFTISGLNGHHASLQIYLKA